MDPKQNSQIQVPKSFWSRPISKCSSHSKFYPTSLQIHSTQTTQGEAIGADPGMALPLEALSKLGQSKPGGLNRFLKLFKSGPSLTELSAGYSRKWCCQSCHSSAIPDLSPGQVFSPLAPHKARMKPREHTDPPTQPHSCPHGLGQPRLLKELSWACRLGFLWKHVPGLSAGRLRHLPEEQAGTTPMGCLCSTWPVMADSQRHKVTDL